MNMRSEMKSKPALRRRQKNDSLSRQSAAELADGQLNPESIPSGMLTRLKQSCLFCWLSYAAMALKQSIMGDRSWSVVLIEMGLWLLLLWIFWELLMGLPILVLAIVYWLYIAYRGEGCPLLLPTLHGAQ